MSYFISFTDINKRPLEIADRSIDTQTSLNIPGQGAVQYGSALAESLLHLLENFASDTEPVNPTQGQLWFNSDTQQLNMWSGTGWLPANGIAKSDLPPGTVGSDLAVGSEGDIWYNTATKQLYTFNGFTWVSVASIMENTMSEVTGVAGRSIRNASLYRVFHYANIVSDFVLQLNEFDMQENSTVDVTVILDQSETPHMVSGLELLFPARSDDVIALSTYWLNGAAPTGNASQRDVIEYRIVSKKSSNQLASELYALAELKTYRRA